MSDENIILVAPLKVKEGMVDEAKNAALSLVDASRAEEGCLKYDIHQSIEDQTVLIWHEVWTSKGALDEHFQKPYFTSFFAKVGEVAAEPPQIYLTRKLT